MKVVDAQVHSWMFETPEYPWDHDFPLKDHLITPIPFEDLIVAMNDANVDAALLVVPGIYGWDNRYGQAAAVAYPDRLGVIGRLEPSAPEHLERLGALMQQPGMRGIRINGGESGSWSGGYYDDLLAAAGELGVPVCVRPKPSSLCELGDVVHRQPNTQLIIDHLGLGAPPINTSIGDQFENLPELLRLAKFPNIAVKLSAVPALSNESFPFRDIWDPLRKVVDTFGADRLMWGTDFTRTAPLHTYPQAVQYLDLIEGLDQPTKARLYGGTLSEIFSWPND